ncbi:hypothetical protein FJY63_01855 [Candidatus Sumerlaeota bacterium]|nr:hypothetical protein [Candidatus Sumerlaeota bacterium]
MLRQRGVFIEFLGGTKRHEGCHENRFGVQPGGTLWSACSHAAARLSSPKSALLCVPQDVSLVQDRPRQSGSMAARTPHGLAATWALWQDVKDEHPTIFIEFRVA